MLLIPVLIKDETWKEHPGIVDRIGGEHIAKLIRKGWKFKTVLRVEED